MSEAGRDSDAYWAEVRAAAGRGLPGWTLGLLGTTGRSMDRALARMREQEREAMSEDETSREGWLAREFEAAARASAELPPYARPVVVPSGSGERQPSDLERVRLDLERSEVALERVRADLERVRSWARLQLDHPDERISPAYLVRQLFQALGWDVPDDTAERAAALRYWRPEQVITADARPRPRHARPWPCG